jgi:hypothetical protein
LESMLLAFKSSWSKRLFGSQDGSVQRDFSAASAFPNNL